jgi:hypothetical protein
MAAIPNFRGIVDRVYARGGWNLTNLQGCGAFTRAVGVEAHADDKRFVMLKKKASRTHAVDSKGRLHGADVLLFVESSSKAIAIDIIGSSASPDAKPAWTPEKVDGKPFYRYTAADGFAPDYGSVTPPKPEEPTGDRLAAVLRELAHIQALLTDIAERYK